MISNEGLLAEITGLLLDRDKVGKVPSRQERRRRQEEYRRDLTLQIKEEAQRRNREARRINQLEKQHELKSVRRFVREALKPRADGRAALVFGRCPSTEHAEQHARPPSTKNDSYRTVRAVVPYRRI